MSACQDAAAALAGVDRILLLTSGARALDAVVGGAIVHPPGTAVSSSLLTCRPAAAGFDGHLNRGPTAGPGGGLGSDGPGGGLDGTPAVDPGVGVVVGASLLIAAGVQALTTAIELVGSAGLPDGLDQDIVDSTDRVGLLVIAEGSASRGPDSPGGGHDLAAGFDSRLADALAAGDPAALAQANMIEPALARTLIFTSGPTFTALAELTRRRPPQRSEMLFRGAPLGVGFLVVTWSWD